MPLAMGPLEPRLCVTCCMRSVSAPSRFFIGCGFNGTDLAPSPQLPAPRSGAIPGSPIQHVVIIMQENRTVDNLFNGFPGADTVQIGMNKGVPILFNRSPWPILKIWTIAIHAGGQTGTKERWMASPKNK